MDEKEVVSAVLATLADKVGQDRFELWFGANVRVVLRGSTLEVQVPNRFYQDWLRRNFRNELEIAAAEVTGRAMMLEFRICESLARKPSPQSVQPRLAQSQLSFAAPEPAAELTPHQEDTATAILERPRRVVKAVADESPPPPRRKYASLATFVVGASNRLAHAAAEMVAQRSGTINPLVLYGGTGVGKTHLLEGILSEARRLNRHTHAIYLTAEQFTSQFLEALRGTGLPSFRRKYRGVDLLILDDVQFFAGKRATLIEVLHTIDTLVQQGRQVVVAADRAPGELAELGSELAARLAAGMASRIEPPDHQTRLGIIRRRAAMQNLELADDVQEFIAVHLTSHARELAGALVRLQAMSRILNEPITRALAEEALSEMIHQNAKPVQLTDIEKAVCDVFGLSPSSLQNARRAKALNAPRMLAMWLARKHTRAALTEIGQYYGRRSHSTVISAHKTVGKWVAEQATIELSEKSWKIEEAIRRVEEKLRAG